MTLRRFLDEDMFGDPIDPNMMYEVQVWPRNYDAPRGMKEWVSGEELLAAADILDQLMPLVKGDGNDDEKQRDSVQQSED